MAQGVSKDLFAVTSQPTSTPSRKRTSVPVHKRAGTKAATFYFAPEVLEQLEAAWLARRAVDPQASKSAMVEEALRAYLDSLA